MSGLVIIKSIEPGRLGRGRPLRGTVADPRLPRRHARQRPLAAYSIMVQLAGK